MPTGPNGFDFARWIVHDVKNIANHDIIADMTLYLLNNLFCKCIGG